MPLGELISSLQDNPYFGAGFGLVGVGAVLAALRRGVQVGSVIFRRNCMMTLEIPCRDKSYQWLLQWIQKNAKNTQHLSVETTFEQLETGKISTSFDFVPSVGVHFFTYQSRWIRVERTREQQSLDIQMGIPYETVTLTTLGRNKDLYVDILFEARKQALMRHEGKTVMYTAMGHEWREFGPARKRRPLSSVVLHEDQGKKILNDIQNFVNSEKWYEERGVPFRRGYLLHGPPGCGKTSLITALAGELEYSICILNLSERGLTDDRLNYLLTVAPSQSIILLEDIDAAFVSRQESAQMKAAYDGLSRVTFSGLLNMLDGVASAQGRILFMTTNYLERLDPALIRPGRVDVKEYIGYASDQQLKKAFNNFYPNASDQQMESFTTIIRKHDKPISMAAVQGFFLFFKDDPEAALENTDLIFKQ